MSKVGAYLSGAANGACSKGSFLAVPTNIRPVANVMKHTQVKHLSGAPLWVGSDLIRKYQTRLARDKHSSLLRTVNL